MNIALTGSHSTGKTTLLREVKQCCRDLRISSIEEVARNVIKNGFPMGKLSTTDSYVNFVNDQLRAERLIDSRSYDLLISDRTILDAVAYSSVNERVLKSPVPHYVIQMLKEVWRLEARLYDLYVYCPIEFPMVNDGVRDDGEDYRQAVDTEIAALLRESVVPMVTVRGSSQERARILESSIRRSLSVRSEA